MSNNEKKISKILIKNGIIFKNEKTFSNLKRKGFLRFDFYFVYNNEQIIIEYDGEYHWKPIKGRLAMVKQQEYDRIKNSYCLKNNIKLFRIPYWENFETLDDLLQDKFIVTNKWHNDILREQKNI